MLALFALASWAGVNFGASWVAAGVAGLLDGGVGTSVPDWFALGLALLDASLPPTCEALPWWPVGFGTAPLVLDGCAVELALAGAS
jgi:hypothetical protein